MSFDGVIQIVPQSAQSTRVFGKEYRIGIEITHAEPCMGHYKGISGSIEGFALA